MKTSIAIFVNEQFLQTFGDGSLIGTIMKEAGPHFPLTDVATVILVFEESTMAFREKNNGPKLWVTPEYAMRCMVGDILRLGDLGIKVQIEVRESA